MSLVATRFAFMGWTLCEDASSPTPSPNELPSSPGLLPMREQKGVRTWRRQKASLPAHWAGYPLGGGWGEGVLRRVGGEADPLHHLQPVEIR
jgi:hypothetical protein